MPVGIMNFDIWITAFLFSRVLKNKVTAPYVGPPRSKKFPNGVEVNKSCFIVRFIMMDFVSLVCTPTAVDSLTGLLLAWYTGRGFAVRMGNMTSARRDWATKYGREGESRGCFAH